MEYSYVVINPAGDVVLQASEGCRYPKHVELDLMEQGYTLRLNGRRLTKKEIKA